MSLFVSLFFPIMCSFHVTTSVTRDNRERRCPSLKVNETEMINVCVCFAYFNFKLFAVKIWNIRILYTYFIYVFILYG
jgi:hypothetical protein